MYQTRATDTAPLPPPEYSQPLPRSTLEAPDTAPLPPPEYSQALLSSTIGAPVNATTAPRDEVTAEECYRNKEAHLNYTNSLQHRPEVPQYNDWHRDQTLHMSAQNNKEDAYVDLRDIRQMKRQNDQNASDLPARPRASNVYDRPSRPRSSEVNDFPERPKSTEVNIERMSRKDMYRQEVAFSVTGVKKGDSTEEARPPKHPSTSSSINVTLHQRAPSGAGSEPVTTVPTWRSKSPSAAPKRPLLVVRSRSYGDLNDVEEVPKVNLTSIKSNLFGSVGEKLGYPRPDLSNIQDRKERLVSELKADFFNRKDEIVPEVIPMLSQPSVNHFMDGDEERIYDYASFRDIEKRRRPNIDDVLTDLEKTFEALELDLEEDDLMIRSDMTSSESDKVKRLSITNLRKLEDLQGHQQMPSLDYARQWLSSENMTKEEKKSSPRLPAKDPNDDVFLSPRGRLGLSPDSMEVANYNYMTQLQMPASLPDSQSQSVTSEGRARLAYPRKVADDMAYRRARKSPISSTHPGSQTYSPAPSVDNSSLRRSRTPDATYDDVVYRSRQLSNSRSNSRSDILSVSVDAMPSPTSADYLAPRTTIAMRSRMRLNPEKESDLYHDDMAYKRLRKDVPPVKAEFPQSYAKHRQELLLRQPRSRSLERPPERRKAQVTMASEYELRSSARSSLSEEKKQSLGRGVGKIVERFECPMLSLSAPDLTDESVFHEAYTENGEFFNPEAKNTLSKTSSQKRLQTPRMVKQRQEMRVKIKHMRSGSGDSYIYAVDSESDSYSSSGLEGQETRSTQGQHRSPPDGAISDELDMRHKLVSSAEPLEKMTQPTPTIRKLTQPNPLPSHILQSKPRDYQERPMLTTSGDKEKHKSSSSFTTSSSQSERSVSSGKSAASSRSFQSFSSKNSKSVSSFESYRSSKRSDTNSQTLTSSRESTTSLVKNTSSINVDVVNVSKTKDFPALTAFQIRTELKPSVASSDGECDVRTPRSVDSETRSQDSGIFKSETTVGHLSSQDSDSGSCSDSRNVTVVQQKDNKRTTVSRKEVSHKSSKHSQHRSIAVSERKKRVALFCTKSKRHPDREPGVPASRILDLKEDSYDTLDILVANQPTSGSADELDLSDYDNIEEENESDRATDILVDEQDADPERETDILSDDDGELIDKQLQRLKAAKLNESGKVLRAPLAEPDDMIDNENKDTDDEQDGKRSHKRRQIPKERRRSIKELVNSFEEKVTFPFLKAKPLRKCNSQESVRIESEAEGPGRSLKELSGSVPNLHNKGQGDSGRVKSRSKSSGAMLGDTISDW
jgi:hypothetical protein